MGIHSLTKLLAEHAKSSCKENAIKNYFGRKIAIDASMSLYQFLIAVRQDGNQLTNEAGETTSHLNGLFYRTIRMIEHGIKPVYVFDGKPPQMKAEELEKRTQNREKAQQELDKAVEEGDFEAADRYNRRLVKVTKEHSEECKKLLTLMGVPYIDAPCEAEAQCSAMVKAGLVFGTATEDMDALTFGSNVLLRHMTVSEAKKMPIKEYHLEKVLSDLEMNQAEFIDLCILLGCDYCDSIKGIGPKRAFELIKTHRSIDESIKHLDQKKYPLPADWKYQEARKLFVEPEVTEAKEIELKWSEPDEEALVDFMVKDKSFNEERIRNGVKKLTKGRTGATQGRIDSFFKISAAPNTKRRAEEDKSDKKKTKSLFGSSKKKKV